MARTLVEVHGLLADMLISARRKYDGRPGPGELGYLGDASADAVTTWRHLADVVGRYANGAQVRGIRPTWKAFWADGMDRNAYLRLVAGRSRIVRAGDDMDAMLVDDSVRYWEYDLANTIMTKVDHVAAAHRYGKTEAVRRIGLELEVSLAVAQAYTGVDLTTLRRTVLDSGENRPAYPGRAADGGRKWEAHPLFDLITANRPTV